MLWSIAKNRSTRVQECKIARVVRETLGFSGESDMTLIIARVKRKGRVASDCLTHTIRDYKR